MSRRIWLTMFVLALISSHALVAAGKPTRYLKKETTVDMRAMEKVFVGWMDLHPDDWAKLGYPTKVEWELPISRLNNVFHTLCKTKWLDDRAVVFGESAKDEAPPGQNLIVRFTDVKIDYDHYQLFLGIEFVEPSTQKVLGSLPVRAYYGNDWGLEGFLKAALEEVNLKLQIEITGLQQPKKK